MAEIRHDPASGAPTQTGLSEGCNTLLAVIVLYRCSPEASTSVTSLSRTLRRNQGASISVLLYDNSPEPWRGPLPGGWQYVHDPANGGILAAYSRALAMAQGSCSWLLLLDQDSDLSEDFLVVLRQEIANAGPEVAAIVPVVKDGHAIVSPRRVLLGRTVPISAPGSGQGVITAINSGAAVRVSAVSSLGGFNPAFWLDYQDYWLFDALARLGSRILVSRNVLHHRLSVLDCAGSMSVDRYTNILDAEMRFINGYRPWLERPVLLLRLASRLFRQRRSAALSALAPLTRRALLRQLDVLVRGWR